jgi:hypothetical protein
MSKRPKSILKTPKERSEIKLLRYSPKICKQTIEALRKEREQQIGLRNTFSNWNPRLRRSENIISDRNKWSQSLFSSILEKEVLWEN